MKQKMAGLPLDAIGYSADGAVVLSDADLLALEAVAKVKAGGEGTNSNCNGTTNNVCRNTLWCNGSDNGDCVNGSNCAPPPKKTIQKY